MSLYIIDAQTYNQGKIGAIVKLAIDYVEDDLTNIEISNLYTFAKEIVFHVAVTSPKYLRTEDVPKSVAKDIELEISENLRKNYFEQNNQTDRSESHIQRQIYRGVEHMLNSFYKEACLLTQPWIKDKSKTIQDLVEEKSHTLGKRIEIKEYARYDIKHDANQVPLKLGITIEL